MHSLASEDLVKPRMEMLRNRYLNDALDSANPIVCEFLKEYKAFVGGRVLKYITPLCGMERIEKIALPIRGGYY